VTEYYCHPELAERGSSNFWLLPKRKEEDLSRGRVLNIGFIESQDPFSAFSKASVFCYFVF
jgi:hypothetical protein